MKTAFGSSQHATNWMTIALLTLFVIGFGIFANSRVDAQVSNLAGPMQEQSQSVEYPAICKELNNHQWLGRIHTILTEKACQSEYAELAQLVSELTSGIIPGRGS